MDTHRYYQIGNKLYVSVTTTLSIIRSKELERWRGELGNEEADRIRDEAADLGSTIHKICELYDMHKEIFLPEDDNIKQMFEAYKQWADATVKEWIKIEDVVWCDHYWYAGRLDRLAILKGDRTKTTVIDLKTSGIVTKTMGLQLAAYQHALEDIGIKPKRRLIVHIDKKKPGNLKIHEFTDYETDFRMFLYSLELFRFFEGGKRKDVSIIETGNSTATGSTSY
jgi:hypothetical protein